MFISLRLLPKYVDFHIISSIQTFKTILYIEVEITVKIFSNRKHEFLAYVQKLARLFEHTLCEVFVTYSQAEIRTFLTIKETF